MHNNNIDLAVVKGSLGLSKQEGMRGVLSSSSAAQLWSLTHLTVMKIHYWVRNVHMRACIKQHNLDLIIWQIL